MFLWSNWKLKWILLIIIEIIVVESRSKRRWSSEYSDDLPWYYRGFSRNAYAKVPPNDRADTICGSCANCLKNSSMEYRQVSRHDSMRASYCYTSISLTSDNSVVVKRGAARPPPELFHTNIQSECPARIPVFGKVGEIFYCFCSENNCNSVAFNDWGLIRNPPRAGDPYRFNEKVQVPKSQNYDYTEG